MPLPFDLYGSFRSPYSDLAIDGWDCLKQRMQPSLIEQTEKLAADTE